MVDLTLSYVIMVFVLLSTNGANSQILKVGITLVKNTTATALGACKSLLPLTLFILFYFIFSI